MVRVGMTDFLVSMLFDKYPEGNRMLLLKVYTLLIYSILHVKTSTYTCVKFLVYGNNGNL